MTDERTRDSTGRFQNEGGEPLSEKPVKARIPQGLYEIVSAMPDKAKWIRAAIEEKAIRDGLWEKL